MNNHVSIITMEDCGLLKEMYVRTLHSFIYVQRKWFEDRDVIFDIPTNMSEMTQLHLLSVGRNVETSN